MYNAIRKIINLTYSFEKAKNLYLEKRYIEAIDIANKLVKDKIYLIQSYKLIAKANEAMGMNDKALNYINKAIELKPNDYEAYKQLGNLYLSDNKNCLAEKAYRKSISINNKYSPSIANLGLIYLISKNYAKSEQYLITAIGINPRFMEARINLVKCYLETNQMRKARESALIAKELNQDCPKNNLNLALIYREYGEIENAEVAIIKSINLDKNNILAWIIYIGLLCDLGKIDKAKFSILQVLEKNPLQASAYYYLSRLNSCLEEEKWIKRLQNLETSKIIEQNDKVLILFAKSNVFHQQGNFEYSAKYLHEANLLKLKSNPSNSDEFINEATKSFAIHSAYKELENSRSKAKKSIFIIGLPRSGSTLIESILSMNNDIIPLGETTLLEDSYIKWIQKNDNNSLDKIYNEGRNKAANGNYISIDKNLSNFKYLKLIASQIFNSKIIHIYRNPFDNLLSLYRANFTNEIYNFTSSIKDTAKVIIDIERSIYENSYSLNKIYHLNYDKVVNNPEKEIKKLIRWLDLDWKDEYLKPNLNKRTISTASNISARSPINNKSVGISKQYERLLSPATSIFNQFNYIDKY